MIQSRDTRGTFIIFRLPGINVSLEGHLVILQCSDLALLFHKQITQRHLINRLVVLKRN